MKTSSDCLSEVAPREFSARTRLQVPLEFDRRCLFIELDHHQRSPGTMSGCVWRQSIVMCRQPGVRVGRDPNVILVWTADALQDVDESFGRTTPPQQQGGGRLEIRMIPSYRSATLRFLRAISERPSQWLQRYPPSLMNVCAAGLPAGVSFARAAAYASLSPRLRRTAFAIEIWHFRELEPARPMAAAG
jgi:hypothetical protein